MAVYLFFFCIDVNYSSLVVVKEFFIEVNSEFGDACPSGRRFMTDGGLGKGSGARRWKLGRDLLAARGRGRWLSGPGGSGDKNLLFPANQKQFSQLSNIFPEIDSSFVSSFILIFSQLQQLLIKSCVLIQRIVIKTI